MKLPQIRRRKLATLSDWQDLPPILARVLAGRGIQRPDEVPLTLDQLPSPTLMPGLDKAVALLMEARRQGWKILIIGDYDADGATATALMVRGLTLLGLPTPGFLVPDRFEYGYGLSPEIVELAITDARPDLIITVDNGIASIDGVAAAQAAGIRVLITDHHLPGDQLPEADAIVNPRLDPASPFLNFAFAIPGSHSPGKAQQLMWPERFAAIFVERSKPPRWRPSRLKPLLVSLPGRWLATSASGRTEACAAPEGLDPAT